MKTLFIIGGSDGIGYATVQKFASHGYKIINLSRTQCSYDGVTNLLCDVTDRTALDERLGEVSKEETLDCFVYSAGFSMAAPIEYVKEGDYRYLYEVNFFAFLHCIQVLLPLLKKSQASVCVLSSIGAVQSIPYDSYYSSSKAALNALVAALRYELEPENVNIISIMPGGTRTNFTFKRKIYPPDQTDGYTKHLQLAANELEHIEQSGATASSVANTVFKQCEAKPTAHTFSSGIKNKLITLATRLLPQILLYSLGKEIFFTESEDE